VLVQGPPTRQFRSFNLLGRSRKVRLCYARRGSYYPSEHRINRKEIYGLCEAVPLAFVMKFRDVVPALATPLTDNSAPSACRHSERCHSSLWKLEKVSIRVLN
jgi:hypothetical protein